MKSPVRLSNKAKLPYTSCSDKVVRPPSLIPVVAAGQWLLVNQSVVSNIQYAMREVVRDTVLEKLR
jgi:hypothetical protein